MASCIGIAAYKDTTSGLRGRGSVLFEVKSPALMHLMSSRLFSRRAGTSSGIGFRALASSHEMRWVGPSVLDTMGHILITGPVLLWVLIRW